ncbi:ABC transporter ATP-binding protein [Agromyces sp. SYSU T00194]|uniref:ABC transporter ATP-binding protein n=1 Tax=Agromyces chitinivorans TaxID=3158560 RepID=UPI003393857E
MSDRSWLDPTRLDLRMKGVSRRFGSASTGHLAVDDVSLEFSPRTSMGIVGESGSGKSTTARMLVGLDTPTSGTIDFNGRSLARMLPYRHVSRVFRRAVQFVGQDTTSTFDPRHSLLDSIIYPTQKLHRKRTKDAVADADALLGELGLDPALARRRPHQVSGGQRQRFALARALIVQPKLLVCDEVVSALDVSVQGSILNLLKDYCAKHEAGLVFVSHGLPATAFVADELVVMYHGRVVERGPSADVIARPTHEYTRSLLDAYRGLGDGGAATENRKVAS